VSSVGSLRRSCRTVVLSRLEQAKRRADWMADTRTSRGFCLARAHAAREAGAGKNPMLPMDLSAATTRWDFEASEQAEPIVFEKTEAKAA